MPNSPIIIIGMHRSGTTLVTKLLEHCGLFVGSKKFINEEAIFFQQINRWLLFQANTTWDSPKAFDFIHEAFESKALKAIEWRMKSLYIKDYLGLMKMIKYRGIRNIDFNWGWKDPVNSITLDLWMKTFPEARVINIIRNPLDVALSLKYREEKRKLDYASRTKVGKREKRLIKKPAYGNSYKVLDLREGVSLALDYMRLNQKNLQNYKNSYQISYEELLNHPEAELERLLKFICLPVDKDTFKRTTEMIRPETDYKFIDVPECASLFHDMNLKDTFREFGFHQPKFKNWC